jgi:hypothetical protein
VKVIGNARALCHAAQMAFVPQVLLVSYAPSLPSPRDFFRRVAQHFSPLTNHFSLPSPHPSQHFVKHGPCLGHTERQGATQIETSIPGQQDDAGYERVSGEEMF